MKKKKLVALTAAGAIAIGALTGCAAASTSPTTAAPAATEQEAAPKIDTDAVMRDFVTAVYGRDLETASTHVAPGSVAERYITYQQAAETGYSANGEPVTEEEMPVVTYKDGTATATYGDGSSFDWSDFQFDDEGRITSWTTPSGDLSALLWTTDWSGSVAGNDVKLVSAYKSNSGSMNVVLMVKAGAADVSLLQYNSQFVASDGIAYSAEYASSPNELPAGASGYMVLSFPNAPFGGTLHISGYNGANYDEWAAAIPVA